MNDAINPNIRFSKVYRSKLNWPTPRRAKLVALRGRALRVLAVQAITQFFAGFEERHKFFRHRHRLARARIASLARAAMLDRKSAETTQLDAIAPGQRIDDLVKDNIDDAFHVAVIEMRVRPGDFLNEFGLDHETPPS